MPRPLLSALALGTVLIACNDRPLHSLDQRVVAEWESSICTTDPPKVDVLIVIDDSASMAAIQSRLAANLEAISDVYEESIGRLDYRIAVTTTDVANPHCESTPEDGTLVASTCRARIDDFVVADTHEGPAHDQRQACLDVCAHAELDMLPTATGLDATPRPRPWLQRERGVHNLPSHVSPREALACLGMVGVTGCTYESPLEAAHQALLGAFDPEHPNFGFLRSEAALFVLFITDEADCSVRPEHADIFSSSGEREFWPDGAKTPTSAICWNAGMACSGGPGEYEDCWAQDRGADGEPGSPDDAVLHPVERYVELLRWIEDQKLRYPGAEGQRVFAAAVSGVSGGPEGAEPYFADSVLPAFQAAYGIGPGCTSGFEEEHAAVPPGRIAQVVSAFAEDDYPLHSVCRDDFTRALACVPGAWRPWDRFCVEMPGQPPGTPFASVDRCLVFDKRSSDEEERLLPECIVTADDWQLPPGEDACAYWATDFGLTETRVDDMTDECFDRGGHRELEILRRGALLEGGCTRVVCTGRQALSTPN